jgi:trehalose synthase
MTRVPVSLDGPSQLDGYRAIVGDGPVQTLERLAKHLRGRRLVMVNSTSLGGGVAEILHRLVRLLNEAGIATTWEVMPGHARFYAVTKALHNALHGTPVKFTDEDREVFRETNQHAASTLELDGDLILIHDPQPAGLIDRRQPGQSWVWRCHIDLSHARVEAWDMIAPLVQRYDAAVFSHASFAPELGVPAMLVPPSIDPLSDKNRPLREDEEERLLEPLGIPDRHPWVTQISRFDRLKDPVGVVRAFELVARHQRAQLILAGGSADDDPEGAEVLAEVRERVGKRTDVSVLELPPDAHLTINSIQARSTVLLQKSLREGFALTVSEGLWKRRAVVASAVGGIPLQVQHERTGLLVRSIEGAAYQTTRLLHAPALRRELGLHGHHHVRDNFLHTREARDYLALFVWLASHSTGALSHPGVASGPR